MSVKTLCYITIICSSISIPWINSKNMEKKVQSPWILCYHASVSWMSPEWEWTNLQRAYFYKFTSLLAYEALTSLWPCGDNWMWVWMFLDWLVVCQQVYPASCSKSTGICFSFLMTPMDNGWMNSFMQIIFVPTTLQCTTTAVPVKPFCRSLLSFWDFALPFCPAYRHLHLKVLLVFQSLPRLSFLTLVLLNCHFLITV